MKNAKSIKIAFEARKLFLFFLLPLSIYPAHAIHHSQSLGSCAALLLNSPRSENLNLPSAINTQSRIPNDPSPILTSFAKPSATAFLIPGFESSGKTLFSKPKLEDLSFQNLSPEEQTLFWNFADMRVDYKKRLSQHEKNIRLATTPEEMQAALQSWKEQLQPFAQAALSLGFQQRLRLLAAAIFDFNRQGAKLRFPFPEQSLAFCVADMINSASRATYEIQAYDPQTQKQLVKEHFLASYIMAIFQDNKRVALYRDKIISIFPRLIELHPELHPDSPQTLAYKKQFLSGGETTSVWELYIPQIDELILEFLIFSPNLGFE